MDLMDPVPKIMVDYVRASATWATSGMTTHPLVKTQMNVLLVPMTVCHLPDV